MRQKAISILIFLIVVSLRSFAGDQNPVKDFCLKNGIRQKSVIIALSLGNCAVCYTPPDELLDGIRKANVDIPVYVITDEEMAAVEKNIFKSKFGVHANSLIFITDKPTYLYMLSEKQGIPSVCCVSAGGDLLVFKHLKHESLDDLFKTIKPAFEIFLVNKTELKSTFISPRRHSGAFYLNNSIYLSHWGANVIAKYNLCGENVKNLLIDSLPVDYLQLARHIFPGKMYKSSEQDYKTNHPQRSRLIRPVYLIKMGNDSLCVLMEITGCGDTVLNNEPTQYRRSFSCMFLFDADLNYSGTRFFSPGSEAGNVNAYMRGAYFNRSFYLGRYDPLLKENFIAEYEMENSTLSLKKQLAMPKMPDEKVLIPALPSISISGNRIYVSYFKANDQGLINSIKTYKLNVDTETFAEALVTDVYWAQMHATKKENYLLWTMDKDAASSVKGYDKNTGKVTDCKEKSDTHAQKDSLFFVFDGHLQEYAYSE